MPEVMTTLNAIREHQPCVSGWVTVLAAVSKTKADDEPFPLAILLNSNGLDDTLWALRVRPDLSALWRLYAVWCVRQVQHLLTDSRSLDALEVAERYARGAAGNTELAAARTAAWTAATKAAPKAAREAAAEAAWAAATEAAGAAATEAVKAPAWAIASTAATEAAMEAAAEAAMEAAWAAAWTAAKAAARAAAWTAAAEAAMTAAREAAREAARDAQAAKLRAILAAGEWVE